MNYQEFGPGLDHIYQIDPSMLLLATGLLLPVLSGVPQGSHGIPGPLILLNYTICKLATTAEESISNIEYNGCADATVTKFRSTLLLNK